MVRKIPVVLAALIAAIGAGVLVVAMSSGSSHREAPLTSVDPTADDTDVYAFKAPDAPNAADHRRQLDPVRGSRRRPELLPVRRPRVVLPQRRQHRRRALRRPLPVPLQDEGRRPRLVPLRAARRRVDPRPEAQRPADLLGRARDVRDGRRTGHEVLGTQPAGRPEQRRAEDDPRLRVGVGRGLAARSTAAGASSPARPTTRSSSTSARRSTRSTSATAPATPAAARTTWRATTSTRSSCRSRSTHVTRDRKRRQRRRARPTPSSACGPRRTASASGHRGAGFGPTTQQLRREGAPGGRRGPGQPPRQPARQRGRHPAGQEGPVQRHPALRRPEELRRATCSSRSSRKVLNILFPGSTCPRRTARTSSRRCSPACPG